MERRTFLKTTAGYALATVAASNVLPSQLFATPYHASPFYLSKQGGEAVLPNYANVTRTVRVKGKEVKIHALNIGTVAVKQNFRTKNGWGELAKVNILLDTHYTAYLPIWVWVIEHPEGVIVIDTGEIAAANDINTHLRAESASLRYQFKHAAKFNVNPEDELDKQLVKVNLRAEDVKLVVLTHLHLDHTDGLAFFPKQEIIVGSLELKHPNSNMPSTYPRWFKPKPVVYTDDRIDIFNAAYAITSNEDLLYVPTPGHTKGHSSVIFKTDDFDIIFAGDTSYNQQQVLYNELAGANADYAQSARTYKNILSYAALHKSIYLPTHDEYAASRLMNTEFIM